LDSVRFSVDNLSRGGGGVWLCDWPGLEAIAAADVFRPHKRSFRPAAAVFFRHRKKSSRLWVITRRP